MRHVSAITTVMVACLIVTGCGHTDTRATHSYIGRDAGFQRLIIHHAQTQQEARYRVQIPAGTQDLLLRADCTGGHKGAKLQMGVTSLPSSSLPCDGVSGTGGAISLGGGKESPDDLRGGGPRTVTIKAPQGATWSIAVDSSNEDNSIGREPS